LDAVAERVVERILLAGRLQPQSGAARRATATALHPEDASSSLRATSSRISAAIEALFAARKKPMTFIVVGTGTTNTSSETTIMQGTPASAPHASRARRDDSSVVSLAVLKMNCPPGPSAIDF